MLASLLQKISFRDEVEKGLSFLYRTEWGRVYKLGIFTDCGLELIA